MLLMETWGDEVQALKILRPVFLLSCYCIGWANESVVCQTERIIMQSASSIFKEGFQGPLWMPKTWLPKSLTSSSEVANICMSAECILTYSFLSQWAVHFKVFYLKFYNIFWSYYFPSPNTPLFTQLHVALSFSTPPFLFPLYLTKQRMEVKTNKQKNKMKQKPNKIEQKVDKDMVYVPCWPTTPECGVFLGVRLVNPATLHWGKAIFPFPKASDWKRLLG